MVNDMLALWLGLAQAPSLLKYLADIQNQRLVQFKSAGAERESCATSPPLPCSEVQRAQFKWTAPHE